jgi:hypothetical protein
MTSVQMLLLGSVTQLTSFFQAPINWFPVLILIRTMSAATRPATRSGTNTRDDFLFVPPAAQPPRTARPASQSTRNTVVGRGTCGLGIQREPPLNIHREWLKDRHDTRAVSPRGTTPLPILTPRERLESEKKRKQEEAEEKEERAAELALRCAAEKKKRRAEAAQARKEAETFTRSYVVDLVATDRKTREVSKSIRTEERKLVDKWDTLMSGVARLDVREASARRREAQIASKEAREAMEAQYPPESPRSQRATQNRETQSKTHREAELWAEMTTTQEEKLKTQSLTKHQQVHASREAMRKALEEQAETKRRQAEAQRKAAERYREKWTAEQRGWREGLGAAVQTERTEQVKRLSQAKEQLRDVVDNECSRLREESELAVHAKRTHDRERFCDNRKLASTVKASIHTQDARRQLLESRQKSRAELRCEEDRFASLRATDRFEDLTARREMHDTVRTSKLESLSGSR